MTIKRSETGDVEVRVSIFRDGVQLKNAEGAYNIYDYIVALEIYESITSATLEAKFVINDSSGFLGSMTGSELFKVQIIGTIIDKTYYFRAYEIESRSRFNTTDSFIINAASDEFFQNEVANVFGNSEVIFDSTTESSEIVKKLLLDKRFLQTKKKLFLEETINKQQFVAPNWRPFDCIYWLAQRSVRKSKKGGDLQNGFVFYENSLGYHFKSIDRIIDDVNNQSESETNFNTGDAKLYTYVYSTKKVSDQESDQFKIETVTFPEERDYLSGLRHGSWSGYSIGFDPVTITSSKVGSSTDMSAAAYRYGINDLWPRMSHLNEKKTQSPITQMDKSIQAMIDYPKRVRYTMLPNQIFDPKFQDNPQKSYEELVELQAYQWMRIESLKTIKLIIEIPGNLDLYSGSGIDIVMPATYKKNTKTETDRKYSGRYVISGLTHKIVGTRMVTEALLLKDSTI
tara:strand:+ start:9399 stop:10766 length:1368 start_codon:yes stop_codon:yes gene_type:complete